jgi:hypothetical protein
MSETKETSAPSDVAGRLDGLVGRVVWILERRAEPKHLYDEIFLGVNEDGSVRWFKDADKALHFVRKVDAELCFSVLRWTGDVLSQTVYRPVTATDHIFIGWVPNG